MRRSPGEEARGTPRLRQAQFSVDRTIEELAVEQKQDLLSKVLSVIEEMESLLDTSKDQEEETPAEKEQMPKYLAEEQLKDEDLLCIDDDVVFKQEHVTEKELQKIEDHSD
ncbi:unnamed protein product [Heligmosomoides polygyrus]|uniref:GON-4-like protein n=1 Tax=Heligmosomoides polygyrus TaxID=6339 RepID=A0A183G7D6_HELPZ|nr:unnamed protein product [Heligmosomoides polygyrus]